MKKNNYECMRLFMMKLSPQLLVQQILCRTVVLIAFIIISITPE